MVKPSSNRKTRTPRVPAKPAEAAVPAGEAMFDAPAPEAPPVEPADQAATDASGTSPDATEAQGTEEAQGGLEPQAPAPVEQPADEGAEDGEKLFDEIFGDEQEELPSSEPAAPSAGPARVTIGKTEGLLHRMPVGVVQATLGENLREHLDVLRASTSVVALQERMRASDGHCTPMIFTSGHPDDLPALFAGLEILAAALNLGLTDISVIVIRTEDAGEVQSQVAQMMRPKPKDSEDDLIWRVHADD